jgi:hypothetical protein
VPPVKSALAPKLPADAPRPRSSWNAIVVPDGVVVVSVLTTDGSALPDDTADQATAAIAREIATTAFRSKPLKTFTRPRTIVSRRVDPNGQLLPPNAAMGAEELFVPGSLPRELPPEEPRPEDARDERLR